MEGYYKFDGYTDKGNTSFKYWELVKIDDDYYEAHWGKVNGKILGYKDYTYAEAVKVVHQKLKKGYVILDNEEKAEFLDEFGT